MTIRQRLADESGQTVVLASLCMTVLLGVLACAVDLGMMFIARERMQTAADGAAIAGAQELAYGDVTTGAQADSARNGFTNGSNGVTVTVNNPPLNGPHKGVSGFVEVIVSKSEPTFLMQAVGFSSMTVSGRAVATMGTTQNCVYTLGTTGTDISDGNGASVQIPSCAIFADSSSSSALSVTGGASLTAASINLVGGSSVNNGGSISPSTPNTGISPISDPLSYLSQPTFNTSSCVANPNLGSGSHTIGPSTSGGTICYNGLTVANGGTATLKPGLYIINGTLSLAGGTTTTGSGVTFYIPPGGSVSFSNGITVNLSAPTSGTYNGILFFQSRTNATTASLEGGANSVLDGILYFPDANLTLENGTSTASYSSIVSKSLTFAGGALLKNYALLNTSSPLSSARLVE